jgi:hypothetical protein
MEQSSEVATFYREVKIDVSPAKFKPLENLGYLDLEKLARVEGARIEIGAVETDCGPCRVHVAVESGMVTRIDIEKCCGDDSPLTDVDPAMVDLLEAASAALGRTKAATRKLPISVGDFFGNSGIFDETWTCYRICILGWCFTCCFGQGPAGSWLRCSA